jgi:hypothetical protein
LLDLPNLHHVEGFGIPVFVISKETAKTFKIAVFRLLFSRLSADRALPFGSQ